MMDTNKQNNNQPERGALHVTLCIPVMVIIGVVTFLTFTWLGSICPPDNPYRWSETLGSTGCGIVLFLFMLLIPILLILPVGIVCCAIVGIFLGLRAFRSLSQDQPKTLVILAVGFDVFMLLSIGAACILYLNKLI
jgi:hypothetical protein